MKNCMFDWCSVRCVPQRRREVRPDERRHEWRNTSTVEGLLCPAHVTGTWNTTVRCRWWNRYPAMCDMLVLCLLFSAFLLHVSFVIPVNARELWSGQICTKFYAKVPRGKGRPSSCFVTIGSGMWK